MPTSWSLILWWSLTFVGRTRAALHRGENTHFGDFEFFSRQFSAGTSMLRLSWSFLQAWVFIEISNIVLCAIPKRFIAVGFRNDEIWFKNGNLAWVHLGKTRIFVLQNTLEFCIVSGHFPSSPWPRRTFRGQSGRNHRVSDWHVPCQNRSFVWFAERPLLTTGQCCFLRKILSPA